MQYCTNQCQVSGGCQHGIFTLYGADFDSSVHTLLNCINVYHRSILNILRELLDCKSESSYIDCLNPDIDCMVYCILTQ